MKKRTERNKGLYQTVDQQIADVAKRTDNTAFEEKTTVYSRIDPNYFDNRKQDKEEIKKNKVNKKTIITIVFLGLILIALIVVGVVIYNGTK